MCKLNISFYPLYVLIYQIDIVRDLNNMFHVNSGSITATTLNIPGFYWILNICYSWISYDTNIVIILFIRKLRHGKLNFLQISAAERIWNWGLWFYKSFSLPRQFAYSKLSINISWSYYWYYFEVEMVLVEKFTTHKKKVFFE